MSKLTRNLLFALAVVMTLLGLEAPAKAFPACTGGTPFRCICNGHWNGCVADPSMCPSCGVLPQS